MSFDTYQNFSIEVADWLNRSDLTLKIPTFIQFAEAYMNRKVRARQMITRAQATVTSQYVALPADFRALYNAQLLTDPITQLEYMTPSELTKLQRDTVAQKPTNFSILGGSLELAPLPSDTYTMEIVYWAAIPSLNATTQLSNWVLSEHPDLYLYATLLQAAPYLQNDDRIQTWGGLVTNIIEDLLVADEKAVKGGVPLKARIKPYAR